MKIVSIFKTNHIAVCVLLSCSALSHGVVLMEDTFDGTVIDTGKWNVVTTAAVTVSQNKELVFDIASPANWDAEYLETVNAFPRTDGGSGVLRITWWDNKTGEIHRMAWLHNEGTFPGFGGAAFYGQYVNPAGAGPQYIDAMEDFSGYPGPSAEATTGVADGLLGYRITLGAVDGALWEYNNGGGWLTALDTRGNGTGDTGASYKWVLEFQTPTDEGQQLKVDNVLIEHFGAIVPNSATSWELYP